MAHPEQQAPQHPVPTAPRGKEPGSSGKRLTGAGNRQDEPETSGHIGKERSCITVAHGFRSQSAEAPISHRRENSHFVREKESVQLKCVSPK